MCSPAGPIISLDNTYNIEVWKKLYEWKPWHWYSIFMYVCDLTIFDGVRRETNLNNFYAIFQATATQVSIQMRPGEEPALG